MFSFYSIPLRLQAALKRMGLSDFQHVHKEMLQHIHNTTDFYERAKVLLENPTGPIE